MQNNASVQYFNNLYRRDIVSVCPVPEFLIQNAFLWALTDEGGSFWATLNYRWWGLLKENRI